MHSLLLFSIVPRKNFNFFGERSFPEYFNESVIQSVYEGIAREERALRRSFSLQMIFFSIKNLHMSEKSITFAAERGKLCHVN